MAEEQIHIVLPPYNAQEMSRGMKGKAPPPDNGLQAKAAITLKIASLIHEFVCGLFDVKRYEDALLLSKLICQAQRDYADAFFLGSLALFHLGRFSEAKAFMEKGPAALWSKGSPNHQMACIEVALGHLESALAYTKKAIEIEPGLMEVMLKDSDLKPIRKQIKENEK